MHPLKLRTGRTVTYRRLQKGDTARLQNFHQVLDKDSKRLFTPHAYDEETIARVIARSENDDDRVYLSIDAEERVIAYFFLWYYRSAFPILGIGIADEYQGQGLGKQLMKILIEAATNGPCKGIELTTVTDNQRAFSLYEKCGFKCLGQVANVAGDGRIAQEWHMYLPLEPGSEPPERKHEPPV